MCLADLAKNLTKIKTCVSLKMACVRSEAATSLSLRGSHLAHWRGPAGTLLCSHAHPRSVFSVIFVEKKITLLPFCWFIFWHMVTKIVWELKENSLENSLCVHLNCFLLGTVHFSSYYENNNFNFFLNCTFDLIFFMVYRIVIYKHAIKTLGFFF